MIYAGIDAGSRTIKIVLFDGRTHRVLGSGICDQGVEQRALATGLMNRALRKARLTRRDVSRIVATGYGRDALDFADTTITEITCHARGVRHVAPRARTVVDIGGQDSKLIRLDADGKVRDFVMNDRCAAGTGRFLEVVAARFRVDIETLGKLASRAGNPAPISSMCVVFAETEIIGLLASGARPENLVAGVQASIASRLYSMSSGKMDQPVLLTGGVALVPGMARALRKTFGFRVTVAPHPQFTGALGAALLAAEP